jgi:hypothetical protein
LVDAGLAHLSVPDLPAPRCPDRNRKGSRRHQQFNNWAIPNSTSQHVYGRVAGGVVAAVTNTVALTMNVSQTIRRQGGNDFYGAAGFKVSF